jgi:hypothetical protein
MPVSAAGLVRPPTTHEERLARVRRRAGRFMRHEIALARGR